MNQLDTLRWVVGDLAVGDSATLTVTAVANSAGSIFNSATVTGININPTSASTTLVVSPDPTITIALDDNTFCDGGVGTITATVTGGSGLSKWQHDFPGGGTTWVNEGGNVNPYITPALVTGTHTYRAQLTQSVNGCFVNSPNVSISVAADPVVNLTVATPNFCVGGSTTLTATASGGQGSSYTYQWQQLVSSVWTNIGTNSNSYPTGVINTAGIYTYRVIVTQPSNGCEVISANAIVTVAPDPAVTISSPADTLCLGGTNVITANITGGVGCSYTWQKLVSGTWTNVQTSGTTYNLPTSLALGTHQYRFVISNCHSSCGPTVISNTLTFLIITGPTLSLEYGNPNICVGGTVSFLAIYQGGQHCEIRYEYRAGTSGTWSTVDTGNPIYLTNPNLGVGTHQIRAVYGACDPSSGCGDVFSAPVTFTVHTDPELTIFASAPELCSNGVNTFTSSVTGGYGINQYQWQVNPSGSGWENISGAIFPTYIATAPPGTYQYRAMLNQNLGCSDMSNTINITINQAPLVSVVAPGNPYCNGETVVIDATGTNGNGSIISYAWSGPNGFSSNSEDFTINSGSPSYPGPGSHLYSVTVTDDEGCTATTTIIIEIEINPVVIASASIYVAPDPFSGDPGQVDPRTPNILTHDKGADTEPVQQKRPKGNQNLGGGRAMMAFPCSCAHRWQEGSHWNPDGTINDLSNAPPELGIIACGSSASTENALFQHACPYNSSLFNITLGADCFQPDDNPLGLLEGRTNVVNAPVNGQDIIWFNFDIRPFAGSFQYQITPGSGELGWALYFSGDPEAGVHMGPGTDSLSGNCNNIYYYDCGISANGWITYTVPSFEDPSNYYLAIWRNNGQNFTNQNVTFKGRYGCGDADVILCLIEEDTTYTTCNTDGTYSIVTQVQGINGTYVGVDNTNTPGVTFDYNPDPLTLTNLGSANPVITGTLTANYPNGVPYNFTIYEDTGSPNNSSGNNDSNNSCSLTISGAAPNCCLLEIDYLSVIPETCPDSADGSIAVIITGVVIAEYSLDDINYQSSNIFTGLSSGLYNVYVRIPGNPFCFDFFPNAFVPVLGCPTEIEICEDEDIQLEATGYPGTGTITGYSWSGPLGFTSTAEDTVILHTSPFYPGVGTHVYSVTVVDDNGCTGTSEVTVTIYDVPVASITAVDTAFCIGNTTTLNATVSGGEDCSIVWQVFSGGTWQTIQTGSTQYVLPANLQVGVYQYRLVYGDCASDVCPDAVSNTIDIEVLPLGDIVIAASLPSICEGGDATFTASITGGNGCTLIWHIDLTQWVFSLM